MQNDAAVLLAGMDNVGVTADIPGMDGDVLRRPGNAHSQYVAFCSIFLIDADQGRLTV
nr:hypothetical protein [Pseudomonas tohonis]